MGFEGWSEVNNTETSWPQQYEMKSSDKGEDGEDGKNPTLVLHSAGTSTEIPSEPRQLTQDFIFTSSFLPPAE